MSFTLYIGNKAFSSWSLRGWLALKATGVAFTEVMIPLRLETTAALLKQYSPSKKIPVLKHNDLVVHDTLAIGEYVAELFPEAGLWTKDQTKRALARSICAEIHSGVPNLRSECPMAIKDSIENYPISEKTELEIARIFEIWNTCLKSQPGPFLFGSFSLVDIFFAPIVSRFKTYHIEIPSHLIDYTKSVWNHPHMQEWITDALHE